MNRPDLVEWRALGLTRRRWFQSGIAFLVLGFAAILMHDFASRDDWWIHGAWCCMALTLVVVTLSNALRHGFVLVLRDHLIVFTGAFAMYFVVGAALLAFGPEDAIADNLAYYPIDARMALSVDAMNGVGFGIALITAALVSRDWFFRQADRVSIVASRVTAITAMSVLIGISFVALIFTLSVDLNLRTGMVSGLWRTLAQLSIVAIYLGSSYFGRHQWKLRMAAIAIASLSAMGGLLQFSKAAMLLPLAALILGLAVRYGARRVVPVGGTLLAILFISAGGVVQYSRNNMDAGSGADIEQRQNVLSEGYDRSRDRTNKRSYNAWGRLSYVPSQAAAIDFYDSGRGGNDLGLIPWLFVPRMLAPNKPVITQTSVEFNTKITGNVGSSTGQGIFSSGYYNAGWPGVILASILCGAILAQTSSIANAIMMRRALLLLPFALLGVYIAFRIDGHFIADYLGAFVLILYPLLAGTFMLAVQKKIR